MDIKPRYNKHRIGAMSINPVQATNEDLNDFVMTTRTGGSGLKLWQLTLDCRSLAGKLINHDEASKLIIKNNEDFILTVQVIHPKVEAKLIIGGNQVRGVIVYTNKKIEPFFKKIEEWLKFYLAGIVPAECLFCYGRRDSYGMIPNLAGQLAYVHIQRDSYGAVSTRFGQPYVEASWGFVD